MRTLDLGGVRVDRIVEIDPLWVDAFWFYKNIDQAALDRNAAWLGPRLYDPTARMFAISFHSWLVRAGGLNILVDTCNGNHKERPTMHWQHRLKLDTYMRALAAHGLTADDIDVVMCTHLHTDHVGWNTRLEDGRWVPTFRNARHVFSRREYEHHVARQKETPDVPIGHGSFRDSVLPVVEAGLVDFIDNQTEVAGCLSVEQTPGHTHGHVAYRLRSGGEEALFCGDVMHSPIQIAHPEVNSGYCSLPDVARRTRRRVLEDAATNGTLIMPVHFGAPHCGHVRRQGDGFRFEPSDWPA